MKAQNNQKHSKNRIKKFLGYDNSAHGKSVLFYLCGPDELLRETKVSNKLNQNTLYG